MAGYKAKEDRLLTKLAVTYPLPALIGEKLAPIINTTRDADSVFKDADDGINLEQDLAEGVPASEIKFDTTDSYSYKTQRRALSYVILDKSTKNKAEIVKEEKRFTKKLTFKLKNLHEYRVAHLMKNNVTKTTLADTQQFNHASYDKLFLKQRIPTAVDMINKKTGQIPNTIVIPFEVGNIMSSTDELTEKIMYKYGREYVEGTVWGKMNEQAGLPDLLRGMRVIVSNNRTNDANKGKTKNVVNIWGKNIWIGYIPPDAEVEDTFGLTTMQYQSMQIKKKIIDDPDGIKILGEWDYDIMQADMNVWYCFENVIS